MWYAVLELGVHGITKVSKAIGKGENTLSKWANDQPSFEQSEILANALDINATWLHNPESSGAVEPELFAKWLRNTRLAADASAREVPLTGKQRRA